MILSLILPASRQECPDHIYCIELFTPEKRSYFHGIGFYFPDVGMQNKSYRHRDIQNARTNTFSTWQIMYDTSIFNVILKIICAHYLSIPITARSGQREPPRLVLEVGGTSSALQAWLPNFKGMATCKVKFTPLQAQVWRVHAGLT